MHHNDKAANGPIRIPLHTQRVSSVYQSLRVPLPHPLKENNAVGENGTNEKKKKGADGIIGV